ncbi:hypothetical protein IAG44_00285 [Streptomyces roseirectus]|uniref:Uncharacterized protein n=1 Tax=Streptomyces roseirectus TaxID=2768066 RepID=A0A7H0I5K4_9ACTN|nr:hypothetical protein [Streptomyces roseirectus]QNP68070.1 hypothetical protein IAG44_00285 [Streptomyces roseirectus]
MPLWEHRNLVNAVAQLAGRVVAGASRDHTVKVGRLGPGGATGVQTLLGPDESGGGARPVGVLSSLRRADLLAATV